VEHRAGKGAGPTTDSGVFDSRLSYDNRDRIASVQLSGMELYTDTYTYDPAGRLASWGRTGEGATSATYTWDAACNLTGKTQGGVTTTFASDADNRLTTATTGPSVTTYTHDLFGRRTSAVSPSGTTWYGWNPLGQLTSVSTPQGTSVYSYGATGMREKAVVTSGGTTKETESIWDGMRLAAERDKDGTLWRYIYAPDGTPLAVTKGYYPTAVTYAYHTDAAGSVTALTDPAGTVVASYRYDAFGAVTYTGGTDHALAARNPLRYRGYYLDAATGLYYLPARYYDPATARFLSQDPAPPVAVDPSTLNAYTYCIGDPVNLLDPDGARHVAGAEGGNRVSPDAVELAREGRLDDAKDAQNKYRHEVADNYAKGYDYDQAHRLAALTVEQAVRAMDAARAGTASAQERQAWADKAEFLQKGFATLGAALAVVALAGTPVGWGIVCGVAAGYLAAGYARASLGDSDYSWERYSVDATVTVVTLGVGGGSAAAAAQAGRAGVSRAATVAWGMYQGAALVPEFAR
jgi:RHS repeat-associated protein